MRLSRSSLWFPSVALSFVTALSSCSKSSEQQYRAGAVDTPSVSGQALDARQVCENGPTSSLLTNGSEITVQCFGGKLFFEVEGTFTAESFSHIQNQISAKPASERHDILDQEVKNVFTKFARAGAIPRTSSAELGYFTFLLPYEAEIFRGLKAIQGGGDTLNVRVEPVIYAKYDLNAEKMDDDARSLGTASYSGLQRMGIPDFVAKAEADIGGGVKVDGSSVTVGVTDTGITYNHPTFTSASDPTKSRVAYINDSTGEGTVYINPAASLSVAPGSSDEELILNGDVIETLKLPALPAGDKFATVKDLKIKVSPELRSILLDPASGAKLGVILEAVIGGGEEGPIDMNHNGKTDDRLWVIYVPAKDGKPEAVYFDSSATADFRKAVAQSDFNKGGAMVPVFAEKIGFVFSSAKLPQKDGNGNVEVKTIAFVGYDPGAHGTHVSGIAAGRKTILNDSDDTLARGVAPAARIAVNRVCSNNAGCGGSAGIVDLATNAGVDVINMSLGGLSPFNDGAGVQETLVNRVVSTKNIIFMISAGNSGPGRQTVGSPSTARLSLSIGASASKSLIQRQYQWPANASSTDGSGDDFMLFFSSRGPTASGGFKPNLAAPGSELSSIPLNAAPGGRGGLDVFWGTSMAAPSATGAYGLFLDAIRKYNTAHPDKKLPTDALMMRQILIESARPFDVTRFDPKTGERLTGQYSWSDEGTGMINLSAAWKKLFEVRDNMPAPAITLNGKSVELDYEVVASGVSPNGIAYDGSRIVNDKPVFASGLFLNASEKTQLRNVFIERKLPEALASSGDAGELTRLLESTADEFILKTVIFGSDQEWIRAGTNDDENCWNNPIANLKLIGNGVGIGVRDGKGVLSTAPMSQINVCLNREVMATLPPGDHGALIYAYRTTDGKTPAPVSSFIVPVYLNVPHQLLAQSTGYNINDTVNSFGVRRNYVQVPQGTSLLRITLEVPPVKTAKLGGGVASDEFCSGVELMAYQGQNTEGALPDRLSARVSNCDPKGSPTNDEKARKLVLTRTNPRPGLWDMHVFGQYRFEHSVYGLKADYVIGEMGVKSIEGGLAALNGSLKWILKESSFTAVPSPDKSKIELTGLANETKVGITEKQSVYVENPLGVLRSYPKEAKLVTVTTGGSPGNDIDLEIEECPDDATVPTDPRCRSAGTSGGSTDQESVSFVPRADKKYSARVDGFSVQGNGTFVSTETLQMESESKPLQIGGTAPEFSIGYSFPVEGSKILAHPLFSEGKYAAVGSLSVRIDDGTVLGAVNVKIQNK